MKVRIYSGTPARVLLPNERLRETGETDDAFLARIAARAEAADATLTGGVDVDAATLPADRDFRAAWRVNGQTLNIDMPAARERHRALLRSARAPKLAALDTEWQRAQESTPPSQVSLADIAARKQALRDLPQSAIIDAAQTPNAIRNAWPVALLGPSPYRGV